MTLFNTLKNSLFGSRILAQTIQFRSYSKPTVRKFRLYHANDFKHNNITSIFHFLLANAVKKKKLGKLGPIAEKIVVPVESDANRLVNFVCGSNIHKTGEDVKVSVFFRVHSCPNFFYIVKRFVRLNRTLSIQTGCGKSTLAQHQSSKIWIQSQSNTGENYAKLR